MSELIQEDNGSEPIGEPVRKPSILGAALSIIYSECSIPAADANKEVVDILPSLKPVELYIADETAPGLPIRTHTRRLGSVLVENQTLTDEEIQIYLEQEQNNEQASRPRLLAVFNNDLALPFASFEKRSNGQCSYVQMGSEMTDDNILATADEKRVDFLVAVRDLVNFRMEGESTGLVSQLIAKEMERHGDVLEAMLSPALCRYAEKLFAAAREMETIDIRVLHPGAEGVTERGVGCARLFHPLTVEKDGNRTIELILGKPMEPTADPDYVTDRPQGLYLYALTRGNVALPLAHFNRSGVVSMNNLQDEFIPAETTDLRLLRSFFGQEISNKEPIQTTSVEYEEKRRGLINLNSSSGSKNLTKEAETLKKRLENNIQIVTNGFRRSVMSRYNVQARIADILGEPESALEDLIVLVGSHLKRGDSVLKGIVRDQQVASQVSNAEFIVNMQPGTDLSFTITILGKLVSHDDRDHEPVFKKTIWPDRPNDLEPDVTEELRGLVDTLQPVRQAKDLAPNAPQKRSLLRRK